MANCAKCSLPLDENAKFCASCGAAVSVGQTSSATAPRNTFKEIYQEKKKEKPTRGAQIAAAIVLVLLACGVVSLFSSHSKSDASNAAATSTTQATIVTPAQLNSALRQDREAFEKRWPQEDAYSGKLELSGTILDGPKVFGFNDKDVPNKGTVFFAIGDGSGNSVRAYMDRDNESDQEAEVLKKAEPFKQGMVVAASCGYADAIPIPDEPGTDSYRLDRSVPGLWKCTFMSRSSSRESAQPSSTSSASPAPQAVPTPQPSAEQSDQHQQAPMNSWTPMNTKRQRLG